MLDFDALDGKLATAHGHTNAVGALLLSLRRGKFAFRQDGSQTVGVGFRCRPGRRAPNVAGRLVKGITSAIVPLRRLVLNAAST